MDDLNINQAQPASRESFSGRLGFILVTAACAIGLGNIWRFPYIVGQYGGAYFVLIYLFFLVVLGLPLLVMELSVGRASRASIAGSFEKLEGKHRAWHLNKYWMLSGNYFLLSFYTVVTGWIISYFVGFCQGEFAGMTREMAGAQFGALLQNSSEQIYMTMLAIGVSILVCAFRLKRGVERIIKIMMVLLFLFLVILAVHSLMMKNAAEGLKYYLLPNWQALVDAGFGRVIFAAMGQAFFTLGIGVGSIQIFGSYTSKNRSLCHEAVWITMLDTGVALMAGLIIFPACLSFGLHPDSGPGLLFVTMTNIFGSMPLGQFWGSFFFFLMTLAAVSTLIAVFENIIAIVMELFRLRRLTSVVINAVIIAAISLPCIYGFNEWKSFTPFGPGSVVLDLEDFILTNNILPLGALVYVLFCTIKWGWGWNNFYKEANAGAGLKLSSSLSVYMKYILPLLIIFIYVFGYLDKFFTN